MSSILDTFTILFEGDTAGLKKDSKEVAKITGDLESKLEKSSKTTAKLGTSFTGLVSTLAGVVAGFVGVTAAFGGMQRIATDTDRLGLFAREIGLSVSEVSLWSNAVVSAGGDAGSFQSAIKNLNSQLLQLATTGNAPILDILKQIPIGYATASGKLKAPLQLLRDIGAQLRDLPAPRRTAIAAKLGIDPVLLSLLRSSGHELDRLLLRQEKLGVVSTEQTEAARNLRRAWVELGLAWQHSGVVATTAASGPLTMLLDKITDIVIFLRENENLVVGALGGIATALLLVAAVKFAPLLLLLTGIAAAITLVSLAYDDLVNFIDGNDSLIGRAADTWKRLGGALGIFGAAADAIARFQKYIESGAKKTFSDFFSPSAGYGTEIPSYGTEIPTLPAPANPGALNSQSNTTNIKIDTVEVNTQSSDAEGIARDIASELQRQATIAIDNYDDGVLA